jgi:hypothetical protein
MTADDPVVTGLIDRISRPDGNITVTWTAADDAVVGKRRKFLNEAVPGQQRAAQAAPQSVGKLATDGSTGDLWGWVRSWWEQFRAPMAIARSAAARTATTQLELHVPISRDHLSSHRSLVWYASS